MTYYLHVNTQRIRKNIRADIKEPVVRVQKGRRGAPTYGSVFSIPDGSVIRYSPDTPILPCGARLVIECPTEPVLIE